MAKCPWALIIGAVGMLGLLVAAVWNSTSPAARARATMHAAEVKEPDAVPMPETTVPLLEMRKGDWHWSQDPEGHYVTAEGRVKNISGHSLDDVLAVVEWETKDGSFITSDDALIEYQPILAGQTSPWHVITQGNPEMARASVSFTWLGGGTIPTRVVD